MNIMSLQEWNKKGFRVRKGSKAVKRAQGQSFFSYEQVYRPSYKPSEHEYYDADSLAEDLDRFDAEYGHERDWY